jgi:hypothetical protein
MCTIPDGEVMVVCFCVTSGMPPLNLYFLNLKRRAALRLIHALPQLLTPSSPLPCVRIRVTCEGSPVNTDATLALLHKVKCHSIVL